MSDNKLFYQSGATHNAVSHGITTNIKIDMAFDFLRINIEHWEHWKDSGSVKEHLKHVIVCIEELEAGFNSQSASNCQITNN